MQTLPTLTAYVAIRIKPELTDFENAGLSKDDIKEAIEKVNDINYPFGTHRLEFDGFYIIPSLYTKSRGQIDALLEEVEDSLHDKIFRKNKKVS